MQGYNTMKSVRAEVDKAFSKGIKEGQLSMLRFVRKIGLINLDMQEFIMAAIYQYVPTIELESEQYEREKELQKITDEIMKLC